MLKKNLHLWLGSYIRQRLRLLGRDAVAEPIHILFCMADHFEPQWGRPDYATECARVERWCGEYPRLLGRYRDADGRPPRHTFFYPAEEYRPEHIDKLAELVCEGYGEVEIHLHHDADTAEGLREKLEIFKRRLHQSHGLLSMDAGTGEILYGFIHGNWALDNSRKDGRWCGVNNELRILRETGCYADFTLPSAPGDTQTAKINGIYYAIDDPLRPKSHNTGVDVEAGHFPTGDIMIVQGPLALNWKRRKMLIFPRIENGEISTKNPPVKDRIDLWVRQHIHVKGNPQWVFVKVHTHGCVEEDRETLLGPAIVEMHAYLQEGYNDGNHYKLHYVTAREVYNIIKAAEDGKRGDPGQYRNYVLQPPEAMKNTKHACSRWD